MPIYPAEQYARTAARSVDPRHADGQLWDRHVAAHEGLIEGLSCRDVECYLAVELPQAANAGAMVSDARRALWRVGRRVQSAAGVQTAAPVMAEQLALLREREAALFDRLQGPLGDTGIARAQTQEIQWLLARARCRGLGEPELDQFWRPRAIALDGDGAGAWRPLSSIVERAAAAQITRHGAHLEVTSEHGTAYQSAMVLGALPEHPAWPGSQCELMFSPLERLPFAVDCALHWRYIANDAARRHARRRTLDVDNTFREESQGVLGGSWGASETRELARLHQAYLDREDHPPMLIGGLLIVGAPDRGELERRGSPRSRTPTGR